MDAGRPVGDLSQLGGAQIETVTLDGTVTVAPMPIRYSGVNHPFDIARSSKLLTTTNAVHVSTEIWVLEP